MVPRTRIGEALEVVLHVRAPHQQQRRQQARVAAEVAHHLEGLLGELSATIDMRNLISIS
jgi:hypothetical protein